LDNIFLSQLPQRVILGCVSSDSYNGSLRENPYNFQHFNLNFLALYLDSLQIPSKPLQPNFNSDLYCEAYNTLFSGTGIYYSNEGNTISYKDYKDGYCLYSFDLTPDASGHKQHWNLQKNGSLRAELRFEKALTETIVVILYAEFQNLIEIDKNREISLDYSC